MHIKHTQRDYVTERNCLSCNLSECVLDAEISGAQNRFEQVATNKQQLMNHTDSGTVEPHIQRI